MKKISKCLVACSLALALIAVIYLLMPMKYTYNHPMPYVPCDSYRGVDHNEAILLINTGSPERLSKDHVRQFIGDMLSDRYVMGLPDWFRTILSRKIIAPLRAGKSYEKYDLIWGNSLTSPLIRITLDIGQSLERRLNIPTAVAMRYGSPSPDEAFDDLIRHFPHLDSVTLLPLFPQYAESSYLTAVEWAKSAAVKRGLKIGVIPPFFDHEFYIESLAQKIDSATDMDFDKLVFSFHSLPLSHIERGQQCGQGYDYEFQCTSTARLVARELGLTESQYVVVYASAIGSNWLKPGLDETMKHLPREQDVRRIAVVAPGFLVDNLETLWDININAREIFMANGGEKFTFVSCLNEDFSTVAAHIITKTTTCSFWAR